MKLLLRVARVSGLHLGRAIRIYYVTLMIDREDLPPIHLHFYESFVLGGQPKTINSLIFADEVGSIDPERRFFRGVARNFHDREVGRVNPDFAFE